MPGRSKRMASASKRTNCLPDQFPRGRGFVVARPRAALGEGIVENPQRLHGHVEGAAAGAVHVAGDGEHVEQRLIGLLQPPCRHSVCGCRCPAWTGRRRAPAGGFRRIRRRAPPRPRARSSPTIVSATPVSKATPDAAEHSAHRASARNSCGAKPGARPAPVAASADDWSSLRRLQLLCLRLARAFLRQHHRHALIADRRGSPRNPCIGNIRNRRWRRSSRSRHSGISPGTSGRAFRIPCGAESSSSAARNSKPQTSRRAGTDSGRRICNGTCRRSAARPRRARKARSA